MKHFIKTFMNKLNTTQVVFQPHPHLKGYARLANDEQVQLLRSYGYSNILNSQEFEDLQKKVNKDNIQLLWVTENLSLNH